MEKFDLRSEMPKQLYFFNDDINKKRQNFAFFLFFIFNWNFY